MKRSPTFRLLLAFGLLVPVAIAAHAPRAAACLNEVTFDVDAKVRGIAHAEQVLDAGKHTAAAQVALRNFPKLHDSPRLMQAPAPSTGLDPLGVRAQRIVAVAVVRTEGLLTIPGTFEPNTVDERRANLEWATAILRAVKSLKRSPAAETDLAEALSKLPETRDEALSILSGLEKKDLVTSPAGYAALAELREGAGDLPGRDAALQRVQGMRPAKAKAVVDPSKPRS